MIVLDDFFQCIFWARYVGMNIRDTKKKKKRNGMKRMGMSYRTINYFNLHLQQSNWLLSPGDVIRQI